ncbi:unnamed protein product [Peniophora sp. CBMAI 1063]|nr:unnamed protein product [Peniophora sp. CBMAI 1063]
MFDITAQPNRSVTPAASVPMDCSTAAGFPIMSAMPDQRVLDELDAVSSRREDVGPDSLRGSDPRLIAVHHHMRDPAPGFLALPLDAQSPRFTTVGVLPINDADPVTTLVALDALRSGPPRLDAGQVDSTAVATASLSDIGPAITPASTALSAPLWGDAGQGAESSADAAAGVGPILPVQQQSLDDAGFIGPVQPHQSTLGEEGLVPGDLVEDEAALASQDIGVLNARANYALDRLYRCYEYVRACVATSENVMRVAARDGYTAYLDSSNEGDAIFSTASGRLHDRNQDVMTMVHLLAARQGDALTTLRDAAIARRLADRANDNGAPIAPHNEDEDAGNGGA